MQTRMFHLTPSIGIALAVFLLFIVFIGQAASTKGPAATSANPIAPHQENGEVLARRAISIPYGMQNADRGMRYDRASLTLRMDTRQTQPLLARRAISIPYAWLVLAPDRDTAAGVLGS